MSSNDFGKTPSNGITTSKIIFITILIIIISAIISYAFYYAYNSIYSTNYHSKNYSVKNHYSLKETDY